MARHRHKEHGAVAFQTSAGPERKRQASSPLLLDHLKPILISTREWLTVECLLGRPCPALDRNMLQLSHNQLCAVKQLTRRIFDKPCCLNHFYEVGPCHLRIPRSSNLQVCLLAYGVSAFGHHCIGPCPSTLSPFVRLSLHCALHAR
jgi:hypothetical protein